MVKIGSKCFKHGHCAPLFFPVSCPYDDPAQTTPRVAAPTILALRAGVLILFPRPRCPFPNLLKLASSPPPLCARWPPALHAARVPRSRVPSACLRPCRACVAGACHAVLALPSSAEQWPPRPRAELATAARHGRRPAELAVEPLLRPPSAQPNPLASFPVARGCSSAQPPPPRASGAPPPPRPKLCRAPP